MNTSKKLPELEALFAPIGDISFKSYFSYLGIFSQKTMFALYDQKNDKLYLRKSNKFASEIEQTIPVHFLVDRKISTKQPIFYLAPSSVLNNLSTYSHWILSAIEEYQATKSRLALQNKNKIRFLPNLNMNTERLLARIEIYTVDDLKQTGVLNVCVKLIAIGVEVSALLLFKLYGATHHKYIYMITEEEKAQLLIDADSALYDAGLRKRFSI